MTRVTRVQELEAAFLRGDLPEQKSAPHHRFCATCKGVTYITVDKRRRPCTDCAGRGIVFNPT